MADLVVRPTVKVIRLLRWLAFLLALAMLIYIQNTPDSQAWWMLSLPAVIFIFTVYLQIKRRFTVMTLEGDKVRFESGVFSKTTRNIVVTKVQDVGVKQTFWQRVFQVGDISIETAGETSRLMITNIDHPQEVADEILDASQAQESKDKGKKA